MSKVLITGGTGLVGKYLIDKLVKEGCQVVVLSRNPKKRHEYKWDINKGFIDEDALFNVDYIIHLAGAGVVDKRWSIERKNVLIDSRVKSVNLLFSKVKKLGISLKGFISASGIGYYGAVNSDKIFTEIDAPGNDFISKICIEWEKAANQFSLIAIPVTILRIGVVLSYKGGALKKMNTPLFLSGLGTGKQIMPWIHIEDLTNLFIKSIRDPNFKGVFNAVSSSNDSNEDITKSLGNVLGKVVLPINVPSFILRFMLGELSVILLKGSKVSAEKTMKHYDFKYNTLREALINIYGK